jgi:hypothetical protein
LSCDVFRYLSDLANNVTWMICLVQYCMFLAILLCILCRPVLFLSSVVLRVILVLVNFFLVSVGLWSSHLVSCLFIVTYSNFCLFYSSSFPNQLALCICAINVMYNGNAFG